MPASLQIVIPGGTGQLGRILAGYFSIRGHRVTILTRGPDRSGAAAGLKVEREITSRQLERGGTVRLGGIT